MSEQAAKILWVALLLGLVALTWWAGPLGLLAGMVAMMFICSCLKGLGFLPPKDPPA